MDRNSIDSETVLVGKAVIAAAIALSLATFNEALAQFQPGEFITYSQDNWGTPNTPAGQLLGSQFDFRYPGGVEVGLSGSAGFSAWFTSADAVFTYLPAPGPTGIFDNDYFDPASTPAGVFAGYVLSLQLDVDFGDAGHLTGSAGIPFGDLIIVGTAFPVFNGMMVRQYLTQANSVLGGGAPPLPGPDAYDHMSQLSFDLTVAFESGLPSQFAQDHLQLPTPPCPVDWNDDGMVTSADITAFLAAWFADLAGGTTNADFDDSGQTTSADITAFLSAWFAAIAGGC